MTCLESRVLSGARMKFHTSMLGTFFVYTLELSMPIFKEKSSRRFLGKTLERWSKQKSHEIFSAHEIFCLLHRRNIHKQNKSRKLTHNSHEKILSVWNIEFFWNPIFVAKYIVEMQKSKGV